MFFASKAADKSLKKHKFEKARLKQGGERQRMFQMSFHWNVVGAKDKYEASIKIQICIKGKYQKTNMKGMAEKYNSKYLSPRLRL